MTRRANHDIDGLSLEQSYLISNGGGVHSDCRDHHGLEGNVRGGFVTDGSNLIGQFGSGAQNQEPRSAVCSGVVASNSFQGALYQGYEIGQCLSGSRLIRYNGVFSFQ